MLRDQVARERATAQRNDADRRAAWVTAHLLNSLGGAGIRDLDELLHPAEESLPDDEDGIAAAAAAIRAEIEGTRHGG